MWNAGALSALCIAAALFAWLGVAGRADGLGPDSPEVKKLVSDGLNFLDSHSDSRLGGKCLEALAFLKAGRRDHPRIAEALKMCRETMKANPPDPELDMYSNGLAIIFLCEFSPQELGPEIEYYLGRLHKRQKDHGGWGYEGYNTGDTSQTQYVALSFWESYSRGFRVDGAAVEKLADWLMKTQDPAGCWGYQGVVSTTGEPIAQSETNCSMLAAGLGSVYICADLLGANRSAAVRERGEKSKLPSVLKRVDHREERAPKITPRNTNLGQLVSTMDKAHAWMKTNYQIDIGPKRYYYLYGLERYKSFQEAFEGVVDENPQWYVDGFKFLQKDQREDGAWTGYCGDECDTAFSILFLLRSTQKSIRAKLGEGMLLAGRGLPANLARAKLKDGQVVAEQVRTKVDELLSMLDDKDEAALDELARDPSQLVVTDVDEKSARRLELLVRGGEPEVRLLAVHALGRTGDLDYVPTLLYAMTDPDDRIVLEAREGLRFISRNFEGYGPPENFTDEERRMAIDKWRRWYLSLRPTAVLEN